MGIVCEHGINDTPRGWRVESEWNNRVYQVWQNMIERCYSTKRHERNPTYIDCTVCERWLTLSNFVEDIVKIDNYNYWLNHPNERVSLDKDIKSNGQNKEYCLEQCQFVDFGENSRQANATRDNTYLQGENNPMYGRTGENHPMWNNGKKIKQYSKDNVLIATYSSSHEAERQTGVNYSNIIQCCKGRYKSAGGFIWRYAEQ